MINIFNELSLDDAIKQAISVYNVMSHGSDNTGPRKQVIMGTQSNGKNSIVVFSDGIRRFNFEINRYNTEEDPIIKKEGLSDKKLLGLILKKYKIEKQKDLSEKEFLDLILKKYKRVRLADRKLGIAHASMKIAKMLRIRTGNSSGLAEIEEILNKNKELLKK